MRRNETCNKMSFGTEVKHCEKCGELLVRKDTEMQWFCKNCKVSENI